MCLLFFQVSHKELLPRRSWCSSRLRHHEVCPPSSFLIDLDRAAMLTVLVVVLLLLMSLSRESYNHLSTWLEDARTLASAGIVIILVGNKKDLEDEREVTFIEASRFAQENSTLHLSPTASFTPPPLHCCLSLSLPLAFLRLALPHLIRVALFRLDVLGNICPHRRQRGGGIFEVRPVHLLQSRGTAHSCRCARVSLSVSFDYCRSALV